jgi:hypothetical protein
MSEGSVAGVAVSDQSQFSTIVASNLAIRFETNDLRVNVLGVVAFIDKGILRFRSHTDTRKQHLKESWTGPAFRRICGEDRQCAQPIRRVSKLERLLGSQLAFGGAMCTSEG